MCAHNRKIVQCETEGHEEAALLRSAILQLDKAEYTKRGDKATHDQADSATNAADLAAALYECRDEWLEDPDLGAGSDCVLDAEAADSARARGDAAWREGRPEAAMHAWRLALQKLLSDKHGSTALAQLLTSRSTLWHTVRTVAARTSLAVPKIF